jgi:hypothetical protein
MDLTLPLVGVAILVLLAIYAPTVYIRKTKRVIALLEQIEANTRNAGASKSTTA